MSKDYKVAYVCDRLACGDQCPSLAAETDYCTHTLDISHAVNFALVACKPEFRYAEINDAVKNFFKDDDHGEYYSS